MSELNIKVMERVGRWKKGSNGLDYSIDKNWAKHPVVYAFVDGSGQVLYVGRTVLGLEDALNRIKRGYGAQVTNHRIHNHLLTYLDKHPSVEILAYANTKDHADLAAFFDEFKTHLLLQTNPVWNRH